MDSQSKYTQVKIVYKKALSHGTTVQCHQLNIS